MDVYYARYHQCRGEGTTARPPSDLCLSIFLNEAFATNRSSPMTHVSAVPSCHTRKIKSPAMEPSASMRKKLLHIASSLPSSGVLAAGYYPVQALKWLGEKSLNAVEEKSIYIRTRWALQSLEGWRKTLNGCSPERFFDIGTERHVTFFEILREGLEMSRFVPVVLPMYYQTRIFQTVLFAACEHLCHANWC